MNQEEQIKRIENIICCYIPDFSFSTFFKSKDELDKLDPSSKVHYLDDLKIIQNCLNMIKTELRLKK